MQITINSSDISTFSVDVTLDVLNRSMLFDISGSEFTNSPAGAGIAVAFSVTDQNGVPYTSIDWDNPQIPDAATQTEYDLDLGIPYAFLFTAYQITAAIKDTDDNIYYMTFPVKKVCTPADFTDYGYVVGTFLLIPDCTNSVLTVKQATVFVYDNLQPTTKTTDGTLYYPLGTIDPIPFSFTPFSNDVVYTGTYKVANTTTASYDLGDGFFVEVAYVTNAEFFFNCEKRMVDVICCYTDALAIYQANCDNAKGQQTLQQLNQAELYMVSGMVKELGGQDASADADMVRSILKCNCGRGSIKQIEPDPVNPTIYNIVVQGAGATSVGAVTVGNTKTYTVTSNAYVVGKQDPSDLALTITVNTQNANTVRYLIGIDYTQLATNILNTIANDDTLLTLLNSLITATSNINLSNLNGKCIIDIGATNYFLSYKVNNANGTIDSINIDGTDYTAPAMTLVSDITGIEAWLNGLGLGTFEASFTAGGNAYYLNILSNTNPNNPISVHLTINGNAITVLFQKTNRSLIAFLQAVVDYLCALTSLQVYLGKVISLCSITYNDDVISTDYQADDLLSDFLTDQAAVICDLCARVTDLTGITCAKMKELFQDNLGGVFGSGDRFYGTLGGNCFAITAEQAALAIYNATQASSTVKAAFCAIDCSTPATCPDVASINLAMSGVDIGVYGLTWTPQNPSATQIVTVKYRVHGDVNWITSTNALQILPNGNISGTSPYVISGVDAGVTYDVWLQNNCGGNGFINQITTPTGTVYTADYLLDTDIYNICGDSATTLYSDAPFAEGVILYTDIGLTTPVTGFTFVAPSDTGEIHELDSSTGEVGIDTGASCGSGIADSYILGNDSGTICSGTPETLYTVAGFAIGQIIYSDSALTTPVTGSDFIVWTGNNHIYNLDNATGEVLSDTGLGCTDNTVQISSTMAGVTLTNVTGISGFTPSPALPLSAGQSTSGTHSAFTGVINLTVTGSPVINPSNITLYINGVFDQCISVASAGTKTFLSRTYAADSVITIALNIGACS